MTGDWRERDQEDYLLGREFEKREYQQASETWDHDHCDFCWKKFCQAGTEVAAAVPGCLTEGFVTLDGDHWVCEVCFFDFRFKYKLRLRGNPEVRE